MTRLGVVGWPVAHSRSPAMQNAALAAAGLGDSWRYQLLPVPPELFDQTVVALPGNGFRGVNVTIPHKAAALALAHRPTERARTIGAANTLLFEPGGEIVADNTDAPALSEAIAARLGRRSGQRTALAAASVLLLGAGGTARAAVQALTAAGAEVMVWNRTPRRAADLCAALGGTPISDPTDLVPTAIVNCTSVGLATAETETGAAGSGAPSLTGELPLSDELIARARLVVDFVYRDGPTPLLNRAQRLGVETVDGLELLVRQGALAFELFTGRPAAVSAMSAAIGLSSATYE